MFLVFGVLLEVCRLHCIGRFRYWWCWMVVFFSGFCFLGIFFLEGLSIWMKSRSSCVSCVNAVRMIVRWACFLSLLCWILTFTVPLAAPTLINMKGMCPFSRGSMFKTTGVFCSWDTWDDSTLVILKYLVRNSSVTCLGVHGMVILSWILPILNFTPCIFIFSLHSNLFWNSFWRFFIYRIFRMFWVKVTLNDCFFSKILLSYSRKVFRFHSISWFGLLTCLNVPIIQRLLIFTPFLMFSLYIAISILAHTFHILSFKFNQSVHLEYV